MAGQARQDTDEKNPLKKIFPHRTERIDHHAGFQAFAAMQDAGLHIYTVAGTDGLCLAIRCKLKDTAGYVSGL